MLVTGKISIENGEHWGAHDLSEYWEQTDVHSAEPFLPLRLALQTIGMQSCIFTPIQLFCIYLHIM